MSETRGAARALSASVREPAWRIELAGRDVTRALAPFVLSVRYTDHLHGEADDVEIELDDADQRWTRAWYPTEGDVLRLWIGYAGEALVPCGAFELDELESEGPPDVFRVKAVASGVRAALRTPRACAYEGQTLRGVAEAIAARHQLTVAGDAGHVHVGRVTQHEMPDLAFLKRLAERYGYVFAVKGRQLVFHPLRALDGQGGGAVGAVIPIARAQLTHRALRAQLAPVVRAARVRYHDAARKETVEHTEVDAAAGAAGDTLTLTQRAESREDAARQAGAALHRANRRAREGTLQLEGDPRCVAGNRVRLSGCGVYDGLYTIDTAAHELVRDAGYTSELTVRSGPTPAVAVEGGADA